MLRVIDDTGKAEEITKPEEILAKIPSGEQAGLNSLKTEINNDSAFIGYLNDFIAQNRTTTLGNLAKDVSTVVRILHLNTQKGGLPGLWGGGYLNAAMFHFLCPEAHARAGRNSEIWELAKKRIGDAQLNIALRGRSVLGYYAECVDFFRDQNIDAGDPGKLAALGEEAAQGGKVGEADSSNLEAALVALSGGGSFILPFSYGSHQTYFRISFIKPCYRLEYFDRQRQTLTLKGKKITGYLEGETMTDAQPVYFDFEVGADDMAEICREAWKIPLIPAKNEEFLCNTQRQQVLTLFEGKAKDIGVLGKPEPAQHPDAINCMWASLESVIRLSLGPESLQKQVDYLREITVTQYIAEYGKPEEKLAAGLTSS
jgi:hypothetical protein